MGGNADGSNRRRGRGALAAVLAVLLGLLLVAREWRAVGRDRETREQVRRLAEALDGHTEGGAYERVATTREADAWGRPLRVSYEDAGRTEHLELSSDGRDGIPGTADDIRVGRWLLKAVGIDQSGKSFGDDAARALGRRAMGGAGEALRRAVRRPDGADREPGQDGDRSPRK